MTPLKDILTRLPASALLMLVGMAFANTATVFAFSIASTGPLIDAPLADQIMAAVATVLLAAAAVLIAAPIARLFLCPSYKDPTIDRSRGVFTCFGLMMTQLALINSYDEPSVSLLVTVGFQIHFMIGFYLLTKEPDSSST